jgi:hypothetical protein
VRCITRPGTDQLAGGLATNLHVVPTNLRSFWSTPRLITRFRSLSFDLMNLHRHPTNLPHRMRKILILRSDEVLYDSEKSYYQRLPTGPVQVVGHLHNSSRCNRESRNLGPVVQYTTYGECVHQIWRQVTAAIKGRAKFLM